MAKLNSTEVKTLEDKLYAIAMEVEKELALFNFKQHSYNLTDNDFHQGLSVYYELENHPKYKFVRVSDHKPNSYDDHIYYININTFENDKQGLYYNMYNVGLYDTLLNDSTTPLKLTKHIIMIDKLMNHNELESKVMNKLLVIKSKLESFTVHPNPITINTQYGKMNFVNPQDLNRFLEEHEFKIELGGE